MALCSNCTVAELSLRGIEMNRSGSDLNISWSKGLYMALHEKVYCGSIKCWGVYPKVIEKP